MKPRENYLNSLLLYPCLGDCSESETRNLSKIPPERGALIWLRPKDRIRLDIGHFSIGL